MRGLRLMFVVAGLFIAGTVMVLGGVASLRTAGQTSDPVAAGGRPAVFVGRSDRTCSSSQRYGPTHCSAMWTGDVQVDGRVVARGIGWAGSLASGRPTPVTAAGVPELRGVPAIWARGFTYAYPPGYRGDGVITTGDGHGLAIALWVMGGILVVGSIGWTIAAARR